MCQDRGLDFVPIVDPDSDVAWDKASLIAIFQHRPQCAVREVVMYGFPIDKHFKGALGFINRQRHGTSSPINILVPPKSTINVDGKSRSNCEGTDYTDQEQSI